MFHVHGRIYIVRFNNKHAERMAKNKLKNKHIILPLASILSKEVFTSARVFTPCSLMEIYRFHEMVSTISRQRSDHLLVFSAGIRKNEQVEVAFLVGCYLIMSKGMSAEAIHQIFQRFDGMHGDKVSDEIGVVDCWKALYRAKSLAWLDFSANFARDPDNLTTIDIEEYIHYSR